MSHRPLLPPAFVLAIAMALACPSTSPKPLTATPTASPSTTTSTSVAASASVSTFCVSSAYRAGLLTAAWDANGIVSVCANLHRPAEGEDAGAPAAIECVRIDANGNYSEERAPAKTPKALPNEGFRTRSADGRYDFDLAGGDRHSPADTPSGFLKATGTLRDAKTKKIFKRAPVTYDEHLQFVGWIGAAIVLQSWVDEGPGCMLRATDPTKVWPAFDTDHEYVGIGTCYGGITVLRPTDGSFAVVNDQGMGVTIVDESSLTVTNIDACNVSGPDTDDAPLSWLAAGDAKASVLLQACGAPKVGDVVAIDLVGQKRLSAFHPAVCEQARR